MINESKNQEMSLMQIIEKLEKKEITINDLSDKDAFALQEYVINQIRSRLNNFNVFAQKMLSFFDLAAMINVTIDKKELIEKHYDRVAKLNDESKKYKEVQQTTEEQKPKKKTKRKKVQ